MDTSPTETTALPKEEPTIKHGHLHNQDKEEHVRLAAAAPEHEAKQMPQLQQQQQQQQLQETVVEQDYQQRHAHQAVARVERGDEVTQPFPHPSRQRRRSQRRKAQFVFGHEDEDKDDEQSAGPSQKPPPPSTEAEPAIVPRPAQHTHIIPVPSTSTEAPAAEAPETSRPLGAQHAIGEKTIPPIVVDDKIGDQGSSGQAVENDLSRQLQQTSLHRTNTDIEAAVPSVAETTATIQPALAAMPPTSDRPKPRPASMHESLPQREDQKDEHQQQQKQAKKQQKQPQQQPQQKQQKQQKQLSPPPSNTTGTKSSGSERGVPLSKSKSNPTDARSKDAHNREESPRSVRTSPKSRRMTQLLDPSSSTTSLPSLTKVTTHTVMALTPGTGASSAAPTLTPTITEHHTTGSNASSPVTQPSPAVELVSKFLIPNQQQGHSSQQQHTTTSNYAGADEDSGKGIGSPYHHVGSNGRRTVRESPGRHGHSATSPQQRTGYTSKFYPVSPSQPLSSSAPKATTTSFPPTTSASEEHLPAENTFSSQGPGAGGHGSTATTTATAASGGSAIAAAAVAQSNLASGAHSGNLSRTQQKLWLQRENVQDVDEDEMARRGKTLKEMERINREYRCVRMTMNPAVESLQRCLNRGAVAYLQFQSNMAPAPATSPAGAGAAATNDASSLSKGGRHQQPPRSSSGGQGQMPSQFAQSPHLQSHSQPPSPSLNATGVKSQQPYQQQYQQQYQRHMPQMAQYQAGGGVGHHQRTGSQHQNGQQQQHYTQAHMQQNVGLGLQQQQQGGAYGQHEGGRGAPQSGKMTLRQMHQLQEQHHQQQQLYQRQQQQQQRQQAQRGG
ncbi:hypothetical protein BGZ73_005477 [Actinomortierella ambigua]|nr:hypothetical protein BGZ73_005477 [Actinomortierella ambigua]